MLLYLATLSLIRGPLAETARVMLGQKLIVRQIRCLANDVNFHGGVKRPRVVVQIIFVDTEK
jgi:hypothetical protein